MMNNMFLIAVLCIQCSSVYSSSIFEKVYDSEILNTHKLSFNSESISTSSLENSQLSYSKDDKCPAILCHTISDEDAMTSLLGDVVGSASWHVASVNYHANEKCWIVHATSSELFTLQS